MIASALPLAPPADARLRLCQRLRLDLADCLRQLRRSLHSAGAAAGAERCGELQTRLAEDRFTLAVLGQFKRGKSSLLNALIGRELLPVGVLPLTSAITVLRYGPHERLLLRRTGWAAPQTVPLAELADYVTAAGNPGNLRQVESACIELPLPLLRRGVEWVDTPGVGARDAAHTATTYAFLPACDAVIFVTSAEAPLNAIEIAFLRDIRRHARKLFVVVNKSDLVPDTRARENLLGYVRRTLDTLFAGAEPPPLFAVSARSALADPAKTEPGLAALLAALDRFLSEQKAAVLLDSVAAKAAGLARQTLAEMEYSRRAQHLSTAERAQHAAALDHLWTRHAAARETLLAGMAAPLIDATLQRLKSALEPCWRRLRQRLPRLADRWLARGRWRPAGRVLRRGQALWRRQACLTLRGAMAEFWRTGGFPPDPQRWPSAGRLQAQLAAGPRAVLELMGVESPPLAAPALPPPSMPANAIAPDEPGFALPPAKLRDWLPAGIQRRWCRARWQAALDPGLALWRDRLAAQNREFARALWQDWCEQVRRIDEAARQRIGETWRHHPSAEAGPALQASLRRLEQLARAGEQLAAGQLPDWPGDEAALTALALPAVEAGRIDFASSLRTASCPACDHVQRAVFDLLSLWQCELAEDPGAQQRFAADGGFCALHLWQLEALSSPAGISVGHAGLVRATAAAMQRAADAPEPIGPPRPPAPPPACHVCAGQRAAETAYLRGLADFLHDPAGLAAYEESEGLCVPHLRRLAGLGAPPGLRRRLFAHAARRLAETAEDMQAFGLKSETLRRQLVNTRENSAWLRALVHLAGARLVSVPLNCDGQG